jgi:hypothetical protein
MDYAPIPEDLRDGPVQRRRCTDLFWLLIFTCFLAAVIGVGVVGFSKGNPALLMYPYDTSGNQCGRPGEVTYAYPYLYYPYPGLNNDLRVCVKACPDSLDSQLQCYPTQHVPECPQAYPTNSFLMRFCIPNKHSQDAYDTVSGLVKDANLYQWASDILYCRSAIITVLGISIAISVLYMVLLRYCAGCLLWLTVFAVTALLTGFGVYVLYEAETEYTELAQTNTKTSLQLLGTLVLASVAVFLFSMFFMLSRIQLAIAIMKSASLFLRDVPSVLTVPIFVLVVSAGTYFYWILALVFIYSSGTVTNANSVYAQFSWDVTTRNCFYFELLSILWINAFKVAFAQFVIASVASYWYFDQNRQPSEHYVLRSFGAAFRFHLGTLAFGSLVLSLVRLVKGTLFYLRLEVHRESLDSNCCLKFLCACANCCVICFERFIEFLDKNAYIRTALTGDNFCTAAEHSFTLIAENAGRFVTVGSVGEIFAFLGKGLISVSSTWIGFVIVSQQYSEQIVSPIPVTCIFFLVSYVVSSVFMSVFEMACDTIIQAYLVDEHIHSKPFFAPPPLQKFMTKHRT